MSIVAGLLARLLAATRLPAIEAQNSPYQEHTSELEQAIAINGYQFDNWLRFWLKFTHSLRLVPIPEAKILAPVGSFECPRKFLFARILTGKQSKRAMDLANGVSEPAAALAWRPLIELASHAN